MSSGLQELRVERHRGMIDVYRLVGLARWESDSARIQQAIAEARSLLEEHRQAGTPREHSQISGYVTEAERILTDAARKQKYDDSLRRVLDEADDEPTEEPHEVHSPLAPLGRGVEGEGRSVDQALKCPSPPAPLPEGARGAGHTGLMGRRAVRDPLAERMIDGVRDSATRFAGWCAAWWEALHGGSPTRFSLALVLAGGVVAFWLSRLDWSEQFPQSTIAPKAAGEKTTTATLPPKPKIESIPGQRIGVPRTVPGLEAMAGYAPTLNAKLTAIVFAAEEEGKQRKHFDLFWATRDKPVDPFRPPERLAACSTPDDESDPTLSPDGLELIFVRSAKNGHSQLMRSVRESPTGSFSEPQPVEIPKLPSGDGAQLDSPQLIRDGGDLIVRVTQKSASGSTSNYFFSRREALDRPFGNAEPLPVFVDQARHFLTGDGLRAFVARHHTIQLCCRPSLDAPFSPPGQLSALNATRTGMAEGPVWVSPAEDFLFYCVTTTNSSQQRRRFLWQVRFR